MGGESILGVNKIYLGDCLDVMKDIPDKSIDMILCDLPYGNNKTACKWDVIIPFKLLWHEYERVIKDNGAIVLTASQPFTSQLIMSNPKMFRYVWEWEKEKGTGFQLSGKMPMKLYEECCVFYKKLPTYHPPREKLDKPYYRKHTDSNTKSLSSKMDSFKNVGKTLYYEYKTPVNKLYFTRESQAKKNYHPTQKPIALLEYLIKTYTNENETILDNCIGSGSTAVAVINVGEGRKYIGIEKDKTYYDIANKRINEALNK